MANNYKCAKFAIIIQQLWLQMKICNVSGGKIQSVSGFDILILEV